MDFQFSGQLDISHLLLTTYKVALTFKNINMDEKKKSKTNQFIVGLVQERRNSSANVLELRLSCINPSLKHCSYVFFALTHR